MAIGSPRVPDGRQLRWSKHNEARRQVIIDAAIATLEESEPGADVHVQQIAERAGLSRTVVYRHFADRADLDVAVQAHALDQLKAELLPVISFDGTVPEMIRRIVATYVHWAVAHPSLHEFARHEPPGAKTSEMDKAVGQVAEMVEGLIQLGVEVLGVELDEDRRAAIDPLVFGIVGGVVTAVSRWMSRDERRPDADRLVELLTDVVYAQIAAMAATGGVELDPDVPLDQLLPRTEAAT